MKKVLFIFVLCVLSSTLYAQEEETEESEETVEFARPNLYIHPDGFALSVIMLNDEEGIFAVVGITEGTSCDLNSIEGDIHLGNKPGLFLAELDGCVFAEIQISEKAAILTEKKCKELDRGSCGSLSGTYIFTNIE
jgi:hypothetical protein